MRLLAPAKLNLGLRIVGRRPDGYHLLESVFVPIDLADEVTVEIRAGGRTTLRVHGEGAAALPSGPENLAHRAATGFLDRAGRSEAVAIDLAKRVPAGAGLGGGSSDAGAVLRALDALLPGSLSSAALADLALGLGADVPYFLDPCPAWVEGIGERIRPVAGVPALPLVLLNPGESLPTAAVFADHAAREPASLTVQRAGPTLAELTVLGQEARRRDPAALSRFLENDLEPAATRRCPSIARLRRLLAESGAQAVGMSGSGPTMYGVYEHEAAARRAHRNLQEANRAWQVVSIAAGRPGRGRPRGNARADGA